MMTRLGLILIISGFLLLGYRDQLTRELFQQLLQQSLRNWPLFLIVIGFILATPKKKRKTHR